MAGRPPKPTKLKMVQGTFRPSRAVNEPKPRELTAPPKPPRSLRGKDRKVGRAEWVRVAAELVGLRMLTNLDLVALECYCISYERMLAADAILREKGFTLETPQGFEQQRPEVSIVSTERKAVREFLVQFGMSPASRSRLSLPKDTSKETDPMEALFAEG